MPFQLAFILQDRRAKAQFIKFFLVGGLNTAFGYGIFALFLALGLHYSLAALLGTLLGILFNFKTYGTLVFRHSDNRLLIKFLAVYGATYVMTVSSIALLQSFPMSAFAAGAILAVPMALVSFYLNRRFVFKNSAEFGATKPPAGG